LEALHAISLRGVFEPSARYDVVDFYLAGMEGCPTCMACGAFEEKDFFSQIAPPSPVFVAEPETFIPEEFFSYDCLLCGIGVVPGFYEEFSRLVRIRQYQGYCLRACYAL